MFFSTFLLFVRSVLLQDVIKPIGLLILVLFFSLGRHIGLPIDRPIPIDWRFGLVVTSFQGRSTKLLYVEPG